uniref:Cytochrome P450 family protein n=1 Tax=Oryza punctata TaxID=4537 RepID=A0A0E0KBB4_ORYPU
MAFILVACLPWVCFILLSLYVFQLLADARRRLPPGPWPPKPLIGDLLALGKGDQQHRSLARLADRYGPVMSLRLGTVLTVVVSTPDAMREIFHKRKDNLAGRPLADAFNAMGHSANSLLGLEHPDVKWRAIRRFSTTELLAPGRLAALQPLCRDKLQGLVRGVSELAARGEPVHVRHAVLDMALSLMLSAFYSVDLDPESTAVFRSVVEEASMLISTANLSDLFPAIAALDIQGVRRRVAELFTIMYRQYDEQARTGHTGEAGKNDVLTVVLDMEREWQQTGSVLSHDAMRALFTDLYGAGAGTTSVLIEWAMADLLQNPKAMRKIKEELTSVVGTNAQIQESDIARLPYLQAVVKETLRLRAVAPLVLRRAEAAIEVQGLTIPKGTNVILNLWAINRDARPWNDPDKFMPERFIGNDINYLGQDFQFVPFGVGRRICLGLPLAQKVMYLVLGTLVHQFEWTLPEELKESGIDMTEKCGMLLCLANPLKVMAKKIR